MSNAKTICTVCNYIYDESLGEPRQQIPANVEFDKLPEQWSCPECGSNKDMFQPCSCVSLNIYEQTCVVHRKNATTSNTTTTRIVPINKSISVGRLVAVYPSLACILEQYGIDYCCGGRASLEDACRKKNINVDEVIDMLNDTLENGARLTDTDWTKATLGSLIDHIVSTYHQPLRNELARVAQMSDKVARVHGENHPEMVKVRDVFNHFKLQLELHMQKEEMVLFPGIVKMEASGSPQLFGCGGGIEHPIRMMTQEHDEAGAALAMMRKLTNDYTPPADACNTFKVLLFSLAQIELEMHQHVHKENNILFPRALDLCSPALTAS